MGAFKLKVIQYRHMIQLHLLNLESPQVGKGYLQTTMTHYLLELNQSPRLLIDLEAHQSISPAKRQGLKF